MNAATVISKIYQKYAVKLAEKNTHLDIDVPDPAVKFAKPSRPTKITEAYLDFCLKAPAKSNVTLSVSRGKYLIKDDTRLLRPAEKAIFEALAITTHTEMKVRSRVGFGTVISMPIE